MPPADDAIMTGRRRLPSVVMLKYSSRSTSTVCSTSTWLTGAPRGPVWNVTSVDPISEAAMEPASSGSAATFTPPAFPRPPACTWALTTARPPSLRAASTASAAVEATWASGVGAPNLARSSLA